ncbi:divergent polysaccharide deacetylase family protein [Roseobacter sp. EG26]|uniref:divergent polysaccharide deacetylase family protein n=1 Tax=Roseobacter sp. EG26 TaxID=3412477 RepID=UPI003CE4B0A4
MAGGFLKGALWGSAVSLGAAAVVSIVAEGPVAPSVTDAAPQSEVAPQPSAADAKKSQGDRVPVTGQQAPKAPAPQPDTLKAVRQSDTAPAALPETGDATALTGPSSADDEGGIATSAGSTPIVSNAGSQGLETPRADPSVSISTDPAQPPAPEVAEEIALSEGPAQPGQPTVDVEATGLAPNVDETPAPAELETSISVEPDQPPLPEVPTQSQAFETPAPLIGDDDAPLIPSGPADEAPRADEEVAVNSLPAPETADAPQANPEPKPPVAEEEAKVEPAAPSEQEVEAPADPVQDEQTAETIGTPIGTFDDLAPEVKTNRLPTLGEEPEIEFEEQPEPIEEDPSPETLESLPPVERFAVPHDNPADKPVMAIVLMDDGVDLSANTIGLPALRSFPYPVSFAVDSSLPDAKDRMAAYRAEGFEVLATINLPEGAQAQDAEISLAVALEAVPEAVGVLEGVGEGVQGTRDAARQVTEILAASGHGFVTQNKGLNTVQKLAAKAGVPSAVVFRDFDSNQQTPTVIRRFLDQAAFRAGNEGAVVMLGRLREDTISALLLWALQDRSERVALVPVSAALQSAE